MNKSCERWQSWIGADSDEGKSERRNHLASCVECREQWLAHRALCELEEVAQPTLSHDLGPVLGRVVADLAPANLLSPGQRLLMRLYWLLATFGAGVILAQLGPASPAWIFFGFFAGALALAGLPALFLLRRHLSWDLMDLVVWTLR